jgi:hypothetical protein
VCRLDGQQRNVIAAAFHGLLFGCSRRRDVRLVFSLWLAHVPGIMVANGLVKIPSYATANHHPKSNVYFQRDEHRAPPNFFMRHLMLLSNKSSSK